MQEFQISHWSISHRPLPRCLLDSDLEVKQNRHVQIILQLQNDDHSVWITPSVTLGHFRDLNFMVSAYRLWEKFEGSPVPWTRDIQDTQHVLYMKKTDFQAAQEVRLARKRPPGTSRAQFWARECVCQEQVQRLIGKVTTKQDLTRTAVFNWSNYRKIHVWSQVLVHSTSMDGLKQMQTNNNTKYIEPWNFWNVMWLVWL